MKIQLALQFATLNCLSDLCVNSSKTAPILVKIRSSATQLQAKKRWRWCVVNANSRRSSEEHSKDINSRNLIQYLSLGRMNAMEHSAFTFEEPCFFSPTEGVVTVTTAIARKIKKNLETVTGYFKTLNYEFLVLTKIIKKKNLRCNCSSIIDYSDSHQSVKCSIAPPIC